MAALSIGSIPPAMAGEGGFNPNTAFTEIPSMSAPAPAAQTEQGQSAQINAQSGHGGWLFPPIRELPQPAGRLGLAKGPAAGLRFQPTLSLSR